jgi:hypothetical protein
VNTKTLTKKSGGLKTTHLKHDYATRVAALKRARGALSHYGKNLGRELAKLRKERNRALPSLSGH